MYLTSTSASFPQIPVVQTFLYLSTLEVNLESFTFPGILLSFFRGRNLVRQKLFQCKFSEMLYTYNISFYTLEFSYVSFTIDSLYVIFTCYSSTKQAIVNC